LIALVALCGLGASCTAAAEPLPDRRPSAGPEPAATTAPSPTPAPVALTLELVAARGRAVHGALPDAEVDGPAEAVRATMQELLEIGFVDPERWRDGTFAGLLEHFAGSARREAAGDLRRLTLGPAAREIDSVTPTSATLEVEVVADRSGHPIAAVATVDLEAVAFAGETRGVVRHHGTYLLRRTDGAWRIVSYEVRGKVPRPAQLRVDVGEGSFVPGLDRSDRLVVLVIGSDARPGQSVTHARADSIHLVGVDPGSGRASILGIPRDAWVPIPGRGSDKINAALAFGGPDLLVETVQRMAGARIDAYVLTGFEGFRAMVDAVGGLDIVVPFPIRDSYAKADFDRGPEHVDGRDALAFTRARHALPNGDFGRSLNQGRLLIGAVSTMRDQVARYGQMALLPWVLAGAEHVRSDLGLADLLELALAASTIDERHVTNAVVPGRVGSIDGKSVVLLDGRAGSMLRDLARDGRLDG
jgi:LCP family protein required for cell wall assembly